MIWSEMVGSIEIDFKWLYKSLELSTLDENHIMDSAATKNGLLESLQRSAGLMHSGRIRRLAKHPVRIICPYIMESFNIERRTCAATFFGRMMRVVLPEGISVRIWRYGAFEEDVSFYLLSLLRSDDSFIDVGAHFGFFSMLAREIIGPSGLCISLEPMPRQRLILEENLGRNSGACGQRLISAAAGSIEGQAKFKDFGLLGSAFATTENGRDPRFRLVGEVDVKVRTLDSIVSDLGLSSLRLIKVDAEDAEYDVLKGSIGVLRSFRPAIIIEAGDFAAGENSTRRALDLAIEEGYRPYEFREWRIHPHELKQSYGYQNLLLVPAEKISDMVGSCGRGDLR